MVEGYRYIKLNVFSSLLRTTTVDILFTTLFPCYSPLSDNKPSPVGPDELGDYRSLTFSLSSFLFLRGRQTRKACRESWGVRESGVHCLRTSGFVRFDWTLRSPVTAYQSHSGLDPMPKD